jgi:multicomponent K+:H+ antiporter subunit E
MKLLPRPGLTFVLWLTWLALNNSVHPAHVVLGAALAVAVPLVLERLGPPAVRMRRPATAIALLLRVLWDIVVANVQVARLILGPESALESRFVRLPLDLRHPQGVAILAAIVSLTPGTITADVEEDTGHLLIHSLHVEDERALVRAIKERYEKPLMEVLA